MRTGTATEREEEEKEESLAMERSRPVKNLVDQVTGEGNAMFGADDGAL